MSSQAALWNCCTRGMTLGEDRANAVFRLQTMNVSGLYSDMRIPSGYARQQWNNSSPGWSKGTGDTEQAHIRKSVLYHSIFLILAGWKMWLLEDSYIISPIILWTVYYQCPEDGSLALVQKRLHWILPMLAVLATTISRGKFEISLLF